MEKKKADVCQEFDLVKSTIQMIWKNRIKVIGVFEWNGWKIKQFQEPERGDVDEALLEWF
jgi:hypothetical protein